MGIENKLRSPQLGLPVICESCGSAGNYAYTIQPVGMDTEWKTACSNCSEAHDGFWLKNPVDIEDMVNEVDGLRTEFKSGLPLSEVTSRLKIIATKFETPNPCHCGGNFSVSNMGRCRACAAPIAGCVFHFVSGPPKEAARRLTNR